MHDVEDRPADGSGDDLVDPTDVVGRRVAGWLVDAALVGATALVVLLLLGDSFERPGSDVDLELRRFGSDTAVFFRSTVAVIHAWEWAVAAVAAAVVALLLLVVLPGRRGWTPGLLAADLRLVDQQGAATGVGPAAVRFVGWVIDLLPGIPLVGFGAMRLSRHHQRVGDRMARTYVVDRAYTDRPPTEPTVPAADAVPAAVVADPSGPTPGDDGADQPDDAVTEQATVARRVARREDPPPTAAAAPEPTSEPSGATPAPPPEGVVADQPMWDRRHGRYVMWHGPTGRWARFDDASQTWKPL